MERQMKTQFLVPTILLGLLTLPMAAHAQGTVRGMERGAAKGERPAPSAQRSAARLERLPAPLAAASALKRDRASVNTSCTNACPPTAMRENFVSARNCQKMARPIMTLRASTAFGA